MRRNSKYINKNFKGNKGKSKTSINRKAQETLDAGDVLRKNQVFKARNSISLQKLNFNTSSVDEELVKLENVSCKNITARYDWLKIEQRLIQLGAKKKLEPIVKSFNLRRSNSIEVSEDAREFRLFQIKDKGGSLFTN
jgi:hypothetical protein